MGVFLFLFLSLSSFLLARVTTFKCKNYVARTIPAISRRQDQMTVWIMTFRLPPRASEWTSMQRMREKESWILKW